MHGLSAADLALLAAAGFAAGGVNAIAGGGSLISFPALLAAGYPPISANVTNSVAVLPGYLGGSLAYRPELAGQGRRIAVLSATGVAGALLGAWLLIVSSEDLFERIVPFLILVSCGCTRRSSPRPSMAAISAPGSASCSWRCWRSR